MNEDTFQRCEIYQYLHLLNRPCKTDVFQSLAALPFKFRTHTHIYIRYILHVHIQNLRGSVRDLMTCIRTQTQIYIRTYASLLQISRAISIFFIDRTSSRSPGSHPSLPPSLALASLFPPKRKRVKSWNKIQIPSCVTTTLITSHEETGYQNGSLPYYRP